MGFVDEIWYLETPIQFMTKAFALPNSLNADEQELFRRILNTPYFWKHKAIHSANSQQKVVKMEYQAQRDLRGLIEEHLLEYWDKLIDDELTEDDRIQLKTKGEVIEPYGKVFLGLKGFTCSIDVTVLEKDKIKEHLTSFIEHLDENFEPID